MRRGAVCAAALLLCAASAAADAGRVRLRQDSGPFTITVFTTPEPLTAGLADVSILVQDRENGEVLLDAEVEIGLQAPGQERARLVAAARGTNRLLKVAVVELATPGDWSLKVVARRAGAASKVACVLPVGAAASPLAPIWPYLAFPPVAVALFAVRAALARRTK